MDDTDWFVDQLYPFASDLGITMIRARLSRWVIDLNRDPKSVPLYHDNRLITGITPLTDFFGNELYHSKDQEPDQRETDQRISDYYWPYYQAVGQLLEERKAAFGYVLLWDAHSIRHRVSTIHPAVFPDMILGDNDGQTAHPGLIESALSTLRSGPFQVSHNTPFKGGHITRYFGNPENHVHALQLEMNKLLYMDDNELTFNEARAAIVQTLFRETLQKLVQTLKQIR